MEKFLEEFMWNFVKEFLDVLLVGFLREILVKSLQGPLETFLVEYLDSRIAFLKNTRRQRSLRMTALEIYLVKSLKEFLRESLK